MIPDYCDDDLSGCMRQFCQDQSTEDPGGLFIANDPTGTGGQALNCNFITLQYRQPQCDYDELVGPGLGDDETQNFCVGSRWLDIELDKMWICVDNTEGASVWVPWQWDNDGAQNQLLLVDTHFGVTGEIRQQLDTTNAVVLIPFDADSPGGAVQIQTADGTPAAGNTRGASAVDFQNTRDNAAQVASGDTSFIAGGNSNTASGAGAHSHGQYSQATGDFSHAEGSADEASTKIASGEGAHAQGMADKSLRCFDRINSQANGPYREPIYGKSD
jgi:hypothetical protein